MICSDNWHKYHESSDISQLLYVRNCATKESFNLPIISSNKKKKEKERKNNPSIFAPAFISGQRVSHLTSAEKSAKFSFT